MAGINCMYCGRFISWKDFLEEKAFGYMVLPDSEFTEETWEFYHVKCKEKTCDAIDSHIRLYKSGDKDESNEVG